MQEAVRVWEPAREREREGHWCTHGLERVQGLEGEREKAVHVVDKSVERGGNVGAQDNTNGEIVLKVIVSFFMTLSTCGIM